MATAGLAISDEQRAVITRRYMEARRAGLDRLESRVFAHSGVDIGLLRRLVAANCPAGLIARIVL